MEETKLDKAVDKLFRFTEKFYAEIMCILKSGYFQLFRLFFGILMFSFCVYLFYFAKSISIKTIVLNSLIALMIISNSLKYHLIPKLKNISDIDLKILKFTRKLYSAETIQFCFEPLIADWKKERKDSIEQGKTWQADWITIRYAWAFLIAIIRQTQIGKLFDWLNK